MKKVLVCLLSAVLSLSVLGCSSTAKTPNYSVFELGGKEYDLSGDMNETINTLAKDRFGLQDIYSRPGRLIYCDSNGELVTEKPWDSSYDFENPANLGILWFRDYGNDFFGLTLPHPTYYYCIKPELVRSYKTIHGINNSSTSDVLNDLEGFLPCYSYANPRSDAIGYFALYVDGVQINMADYRDEFEAILSCGSANSPAWDAFKTYPYFNLASAVPGAFYSYVEGFCLQRGMTLSDFEAKVEEDKRLKYSLLCTLSYTEALQKSIDGKVNKIEIYIYTDDEYGIDVDYFVYNVANQE